MKPKIPLGQISERETDVARLIVAGLTNREIAERLCISERTVHTHVNRMFRRLDVSKRAALAAWYVRNYEGVEP